jgi:3-hydroxybutyryl-CoA dehydratase
MAHEHGLYFEEFELGQTIVTPERTISEEDVMNFARLTGDMNPLHTDPEFARDTIFGRQVAHGLLVLSVALGLADQTGLLRGTVLAFANLEWKFSKPVFFGDTLHMQAEVIEKREMARLGGGYVTLEVKVLNQDDTVVQKGTWRALIASRPAEEA